MERSGDQGNEMRGLGCNSYHSTLNSLYSSVGRGALEQLLVYLELNQVLCGIAVTEKEMGKGPGR